MSRSRLFVAATLNHHVLAAAESLQEQLAATGASVNWLAAESLHLTLAFLGDIDDRDQHTICKAIRAAAQKNQPITLQVGGLGAFPSPRRPKVLWLGITQGAEALIKLQADVETELESTGLYRPEDRPYVPHLTLGRIKDEASATMLAEVFRDHEEIDAGGSTIDTLGLYLSELRRSGPEYTLLGRMPLGR